MSLTNAQFNQIMRVYDERQREDNRQLEDRRRMAYQKLPELKTLEDFVRSESLKTFRLMREGQKDKLSALKSVIEEVQKRKKEILIENGLPEDFLELRYSCPHCRDTGFINGKKCHCFIEMQMKYLYQQSNIDKIVKDQNFDHFDINRYDGVKPILADGRTNRDYMKENYEFLQQWIRDFDKYHGNIMFTGSTGTGKTFLMNCIAKALMDNYHSVIYLTSTDLFESFSKAMRNDDEEQQEIQDAILDCDLLVIDDLGTELNNSYTTSKLFYVLNQRMVFHKSVIISTNLSLNMIRDLYSERVCSRIISDYSIIPLYGNDQRLY
ncbi:ATP-binding protein [Oribacterium sp. WCC10]|uniref:ATP-binding protein n=1 Tax=Oribacterium sp. WCC10 TaxID=1855343 RepID=UPI0008F01F7E|nr:ATP-binding protein [Oribacterium sp. WCC10]SFG35165.1 DNA replication protein DnaC [Oribacterium sp. WCC10]